MSIENPDEAPKKPGLFHRYLLSFSFIIICSLVTLLLAGILGKMNLLPPGGELKTSMQLLFASSLIALVFVTVAYLHTNYLGFSSFNFTAVLPKKKQIISTILVLATPLVLILSGLLVDFLGLNTEQFSGFDKAGLKSDAIFFFLAVSIVAPVSEEIVFRGVLLHTLVRDAVNSRYKILLKTGAVIFSSLLFASLHLEKGKPGIILPAFLLSCHFSLIVLQSSSLAPSIFAHALSNAISGYAFLYAEPI